VIHKAREYSKFRNAKTSPAPLTKNPKTPTTVVPGMKIISTNSRIKPMSSSVLKTKISIKMKMNSL
jgi:hypothetical protein